MNCPTRLDRHFAIPSAKAAVDGFTVSLSEIRVSQEISQNEKIPTINSHSPISHNLPNHRNPNHHQDPQQQDFTHRSSYYPNPLSMECLSPPHLQPSPLHPFHYLFPSQIFTDSHAQASLKSLATTPRSQPKISFLPFVTLSMCVCPCVAFSRLLPWV
jgi:hypothetical protein